ncbi:hypothetical protein STEG23_019664, partial [Scotinomys teguina]
SVKEDSLSTGAEDNVVILQGLNESTPHGSRVVLFCFTFLLPGKTTQAVCDPVETVRFEEAESAFQTVDLSEEEAGPEPTDMKVKEENKPRRTPLMAFLRQMIFLLIGPPACFLLLSSNFC